MFERYRERARRVVFFGRYEAGQFGSSFIDTEHLLLGILRDDKELIRHVLANVDYDGARRAVANKTKRDPKITLPTALDLPLSEQAKRALMYAAAAADRLNHQHIGTEHLLLGLVRDVEFTSAEVLVQLGVGLDSLRKRVEALAGASPLRQNSSSNYLSSRRDRARGNCDSRYEEKYGRASQSGE